MAEKTQENCNVNVFKQVVEKFLRAYVKCWTPRDAEKFVKKKRIANIPLRIECDVIPAKDSSEAAIAVLEIKNHLKKEHLTEFLEFLRADLMKRVKESETQMLKEFLLLQSALCNPSTLNKTETKGKIKVFTFPSSENTIVVTFVCERIQKMARVSTKWPRWKAEKDNDLKTFLKAINTSLPSG